MARSSNSEADSAGKKRQTSFNGEVFVGAARNLDTPKVTMELETMPAPAVDVSPPAPEPARAGRKMTIAFTELRPSEVARMSSLPRERPPKSTLAFEEDAAQSKQKGKRAGLSVQSFVYGKRSPREGGHDGPPPPSAVTAPPAGSGAHTMQMPTPWLQRKLFKLDGYEVPRTSFWLRHGGILKAALLALVATATAVLATRGYSSIAAWFG